MSMGSVPNCRKEIANRYGIRWFKCKLKPPKKAEAERKARIYSNFTPEMIECLREVIKEIQQPMDAKLDALIDIQNKQREQDENMQELKKEQNNLKRKYEKTEHENENLKIRMSKLENKLLESNLIMHGISEEAWEQEKSRTEKIYAAIANTIENDDPWEKLKIAREISIRSSKRLGKYKLGRKRPISICFETKGHADSLYENKKLLPEGVYVDREYTPEVENRRQILRPILRRVRGMEKYKGKCKLDEDKLVIQGTKYTINTLHRLPQDLNGYNASSKFGDSTIAFFGQLNPFSNFHRAPFIMNDKTYLTSEHYIQETCALYLNDETTARRIMNEDDPAEAKKLSTNIVGYSADKWHAVVKTLVYPGIKKKFTSHPNLLHVLHATKGMKIVEASFDKIWGTGVPIHSDDCLDEDKWHGIGILGEILMDIREETHSVPASLLTNTPMDTTTHATATIATEDTTTCNMVSDTS